MNLGLPNLLFTLDNVREYLVRTISRTNEVWSKEHLGDGQHKLIKTQGLINGGVHAYAGRAEIRPPELPTGNTNNYNPAGLDTAAILYLKASSDVNLTGMRPPDPAIAWEYKIFNISSGPYTITLTHQDSNSAAFNRWNVPNGNSIGGAELNRHDGVTVIYDTNSKFWRVLGL